MSQHRFLTSLERGLVGLWMVFAAGCSHPAPNMGNPGSAGTSGSAGISGGGTSGGGTTGSAGQGGPGIGGAGNETVLAGAAGAGGTTGAAGSGTAGTGAAGSGTAGTGTGTAGNGGGGTGATKVACAAVGTDPLPYTSGYTQNQTNASMAMSVATAMSSDEKAQQMSGLPQSGTPNYNVFNQEPNMRVGIRGFYFRDGPRGVNLDANSDKKSDYSTAFPVAIARGAAFDDALEYHVGQAIGDELIASGNTMMLAPTVNILRHPAWGRAQETYGEDVFLLGRLGSAFVTGVQEYGAACAKHYAANNIENGRESANATMDEQTLEEVYARHFGMIIQEGGAASIMAAYNAVNGSPSAENKHLLTEILRGVYGFKGFVLSDWWAADPGKSCCPIPTATTLYPAAQRDINGGLDMELPWRYNYSTLSDLVSMGTLTPAQLTTPTARILEQKYRFKVDSIGGPWGLRTPFSTYNANNDSSIGKNDQTDPVIGMSHIALAEKAAEESMVLLKNANNTLPINRSTVKTVAVVGANVTYSVQSTHNQNNCSSNCALDFTQEVRTGDLGSSRVFADPSKSTGPLAGIKAAAGGSITVTGTSCTSSTISTCATAAGNADVVVVMAGLTPQDEGEEYTGAGDRTTGSITSTTHVVNLALDPKSSAPFQNSLISAVAAKGKPMVVVLEAGSVIDTSAWFSSVPALVMAWYPGMAGGTALGHLLFGDVSFSGKLPITWDATLADWPTFAGANGTTAMDYWLGYRYFDHNGTQLSASAGQFPFGYGLSYASFTYKNLQLLDPNDSAQTNQCTSVPAANGVVNVAVDVYNNSSIAADEIVFLFVSYPSSTDSKRSATTYKELKGYHRVSLAPKGMTGEAKRITIPLRTKDLQYWNGSALATEHGTIKVTVAPSSAAVSMPCSGGQGVGCGLSDTFTVN